MNGSPAAPLADEESSRYWRALAEHRIELQCCGACDRRRFPPMPSCPYCGTGGGHEVDVPGTGVVYSWIRVHRAMTPAMRDQVPYCIVTVDLDGGGRLFGRLTGAAAIAVGAPVRPAFVDHDGWTELRFEVADGSDPGTTGP